MLGLVQCLDHNESANTGTQQNGKAAPPNPVSV